LQVLHLSVTSLTYTSGFLLERLTLPGMFLDSFLEFVDLILDTLKGCVFDPLHPTATVRGIVLEVVLQLAEHLHPEHTFNSDSNLPSHVSPGQSLDAFPIEEKELCEVNWQKLPCDQAAVEIFAILPRRPHAPELNWYILQAGEDLDVFVASAMFAVSTEVPAPLNLETLAAFFEHDLDGDRVSTLWESKPMQGAL
jgi:hypothetical protein